MCEPDIATGSVGNRSKRRRMATEPLRFCIAARKLSSPRNVFARDYVIAKAGMTPVSFYGGDFSMKILLTTAAFVAFTLSLSPPPPP